MRLDNDPQYERTGSKKGYAYIVWGSYQAKSGGLHVLSDHIQLGHIILGAANTIILSVVAGALKFMFHEDFLPPNNMTPYRRAVVFELSAR